MHTAAAGVALDATLKLADVGGAQEVQLVDNASGAILGQAALDHDNFNVDVHGADHNDVLTIDFGDTPLAYTVNVQFDGGAEANTLDGPGPNTAGTSRERTAELSPSRTVGRCRRSFRRSRT